MSHGISRKPTAVFVYAYHSKRSSWSINRASPIIIYSQSGSVPGTRCALLSAVRKKFVPHFSFRLVLFHLVHLYLRISTLSKRHNDSIEANEFVRSPVSPATHLPLLLIHLHFSPRLAAHVYKYIHRLCYARLFFFSSDRAAAAGRWVYRRNFFFLHQGSFVFTAARPRELAQFERVPRIFDARARSIVISQLLSQKSILDQSLASTKKQRATLILLRENRRSCKRKPANVGC